MPTAGSLPSEPRTLDFARRTSNSGQVVVSIVIAILLAAATLLAGLGAGAWQSATRQEIKWSAAAMEDVRFVYLDEAPDAFAITQSVNLAEALEAYVANAGSEAAEGVSSLDRVVAEARAARETVEQTVFAREGSNPLIAEDYRLSNGGYDIPHRLGSLREEAAPAEAADLLEEGDRLNLIAQSLALMCVPIVILWVLFQALAHRRSRSHGAASASDQVDLMPQPWLVERRLRWLSSGSLAAWILLTLMPVVALGMSAVGQRADADSSRLAVITTTGITASNLQVSLASNQVITSTHMAFAALARQMAALDFEDEAETRLGEAELTAAENWLVVTEPMTRVPTTADGVDEPLVEALSRTMVELDAIRLEQNAAADRATQVGNAVNLATLSVALAALSASALAFASAVRQSPRIVRVGGPLLVAGALFAAITSLAVFV